MNGTARPHRSRFALRIIVCTTLIFKGLLAPFATYGMLVARGNGPQAESTITFSILSVLFGDLRTDLFMLKEGLEQRSHRPYPPTKTFE